MPSLSSGEAVKGMGRLIANLSSLARLDGSEAMEAGGNVILTFMQSITPVDTGELRDSEHLEKIKGGVELVADADHATYVELGTSRMAAQPYMRPAIDTKQKQAMNAVVANLQSQLRRLIR